MVSCMDRGCPDHVVTAARGVAKSAGSGRFGDIVNRGENTGGMRQLQTFAPRRKPAIRWRLLSWNRMATFGLTPKMKNRPCSDARDVRSASRTPNLKGDQIGELGRDIRHAVVGRAEPVTRGQHGAFIVEFIEGGAVNDRHQLAPMQQH